MVLRYESMAARNGDVEDLVQRESVGVGVRALVGSSWGFVAVPDPTDAEARRAGERAAAVARASALVAGPEVSLVPVEVRQASWASPCQEDPLSVPLAEKGDLVAGLTATMRAAGVQLAEASYQVWDTTKWFVSSEGARIEQRVRECGAAMSATAIGTGETQRRSYPGIRGQYGTRGWELVRDLDLPGQAGRIAEEAQALLSAPECPAGETDLILGSEQMALQIHESVGHAVELDRILGWEAAFAGTSWLDLARLGSLRFGSELMTITADATLPGALGSFGYDDEGTPAAPVDIVRDGIWTGVLSGRDSAAIAGAPDRPGARAPGGWPPAVQAPKGGMVRADGWARLPMVRMTNVGLLPGDSSLAEMVAATDDGVLMDTNRSWSIDDRRLNFQFGAKIGGEVKAGKRVGMLRSPRNTGTSPRFGGSMDMLGGPSEGAFWGTPNCGKGQPAQIVHTGQPAVPARFRGVRVGVRA